MKQSLPISSSYFPLCILFKLEKPETEIPQSVTIWRLSVLLAETWPILSCLPARVTGKPGFSVWKPIQLSRALRSAFTRTQGKWRTQTSCFQIFFIPLDPVHLSANSMDTKQSSLAFWSQSWALATKWRKGHMWGLGGKRKTCPHRHRAAMPSQEYT